MILLSGRIIVWEEVADTSVKHGLRSDCSGTQGGGGILFDKMQKTWNEQPRSPLRGIGIQNPGIRRNPERDFLGISPGF